MTTGRKSKMYIDVAGAGQGTWTEVKPIGDVDNPDSRDDIAIDTRESGFTKYESGQRKTEISFNLTTKNEEAIFEALLLAYENDSVIGVANYIGDMADVGARGMQMDAKIMSMPKTIPLNGHANSQIVLKPAYASTFEPQMVETAI